MKKLLIVESPAKAKTIQGYLGGEFKVLSSKGHIRDLPEKGGIGLTIKPAKDGATADAGGGEWTFTPKYVITPAKKNVVEELRKGAKGADEIYLAPDPDREGEAIAWHLKEALAKETKGKNVYRVTYNEITKTAVAKAIANPRDIDMARVGAQQARRILDRIVGYKVSPMLSRHVPSPSPELKLSAGRVQSVALRILVERERDIRSFIPEAYWLLGVRAKKDAVEFDARLARLDGAKPDVRNEELATGILSDLEGASLRVSDVKVYPKTRHPYPPFTTSTLQQAASSACGFSPKRTMDLAQTLYQSGLITYMRTDSVAVSADARNAAKDFITQRFGEEFYPEKPNFYKSKAGAQEAHEAIRPTKVAGNEGDVAKLDEPHRKLYNLIWCRFIASQMADARFSVKQATIVPARNPICENGQCHLDSRGFRHSYEFQASASTVEFEGFLKVMPSANRKKKEEGDDESDECENLPALASGDTLAVVKWLSDRKETKPPARFSEASLVKALEENGVGRPSTYAQTIDVLLTRKYADRNSRQLVPTKLGEEVCDWLVKRMPDLFDVGYTAQMEADLDRIEEGAETEEKMLSGFYSKFTGWLEAAKDPPTPPEKFKPIFAMLDEVTQWREPRVVGKTKYDDREFADDLRNQMENEPQKLSDKQLTRLAAIAIAHRDQISRAEERLREEGWGELLDKALNAAPADVVAACFKALEDVDAIKGNWFIESLKKQFDMGRQLSPKQFAPLARTVLQRCGDTIDPELREALPAEAEADSQAIDEKSIQILNGIFAMADEIKTWHEPAGGGKKAFDDKAFLESVKKQFGQRKSLSPKQIYALRRVVSKYKDQISGFEERAPALGFSEKKKREKKSVPKKSAKGRK